MNLLFVGLGGALGAISRVEEGEELSELKFAIIEIKENLSEEDHLTILITEAFRNELVSLS